MSNVSFGIWAGIVGLVAVGDGYAATVDGGVELTSTRTYVIGEGSSVTYTPAPVFGFYDPSTGAPPPAQPQPQTYALSGRFNVEFYRYWWTSLPPDAESGATPYTTEEPWARLKNAELHGAESLAGFALPNFLLRVIGAELSGDSGPCSFPSGPDTYCSGWSTGNTSGLTGTVQEHALQLNGWIPTGVNVTEGYSYHINAVESVPLPPSLTLMAGGLAGLIGWSRRKS
ncbi:hypothetical protein [Methylococcus sp. EFPC2]|uniref:hypothetical protein n=1 Tax=Methylococcus sp. EFPC2 TaxID=2812648 RepID=UPI00196871AE|nr:hypothetical protein [Methylococcus sp. EFPC2]QSA96927.1 hypothetical protein JWZ97_17250 [Methylococcus sp. EFPC2]